LLALLGQAGLGVDEGFEVLDREAGREVESEELLVQGMVGRDDRYGYSRPVGHTRQSKLSFGGCCTGPVWLWDDGFATPLRTDMVSMEEVLGTHILTGLV